MIEVINKRGVQAYIGEYIGRPNPLGNPFVLGKDGDRTTVIQRYRDWLTAKWNMGGTDPALVELRRLGNIARKGNLTLICWCAPKACHGDIIKEFIEEYLL